jgi:hypothetical protein
MHIGAAGKSPAGAGDDRHVGLGVEIEPPQRVRKVTDQIVAKGIQSIRPVERQSSDLIRTRVLDQAFDHLLSPFQGQ